MYFTYLIVYFDAYSVYLPTAHGPQTQRQ